MLALANNNPGLAQQYLWGQVPAPLESDPAWLHLGCGVRVFDGFLNVDIAPQDPRVRRWNLLDLWPEDLVRKIEGVFSEDCLEHFFLAEQIYILCNINRALKDSCVARILMPSLANLVAEYQYDYGVADSLQYFDWGVKSQADQLNHGMRFTGHRWLHDSRSTARMAADCGFEATATDCSTSIVSKFNGLNLRDERTSSSFANDLRKVGGVSRLIVPPFGVRGAENVEDLPAGAAMFLATSAHPSVQYRLPREMNSNAIACINVRSANLSSFHWGVKSVTFDGFGGRKFHFDETLKSQSCMNIITNGQLRMALGNDGIFSSLEFTPAQAPGEYFTIGCAEIFEVE